MTSRPENESPRWHRLEDLDPEPSLRRGRSGRRLIVRLLFVAALVGLAALLLLGVPERVR